MNIIFPLSIAKIHISMLLFHIILKFSSLLLEQ